MLLWSSVWRLGGLVFAVLMFVFRLEPGEQFLPQRVGPVEQDVGFGVDRLQLLQRGLPAADTLVTEQDGGRHAKRRDEERSIRDLVLSDKQNFHRHQRRRQRWSYSVGSFVSRMCKWFILKP
ncbi:hypothetical protein EYF80_036912 [Liparis tanakae]|uniref:Secreted protein n=1 Tax=Liparis tanakae TaxID=230148 RepID=A0A4Z2GHP4_9TELE|nr:hypothetical protein EYF80_036912 [Liparis tanakae]